MTSNNIHFINPARDINKNSHQPFSNLQTLEYFINFGLYSIIQELKENNISTSFHDFHQGYQLLMLKEKLWPSSTNLVGISIISAFNAPSADSILKDVKKLNKNNITIIGGQHYIGQLKSKAFKLFTEADIVVSGEGEFAMLGIAKQWNSHRENLSQWDLSSLTRNVFIRSGKTFVRGRLDNRVIELNKIEKYSYRHYPNVNNFFPSIEFSRGCPHHCVFCANTKTNRKNYRSRSISSLTNSIIDILGIYRQRPLRFYMQASNFAIRDNEMGNFLNSLSIFNCDIEWRTEVRVDTFDEKNFKELYEIGLRVIDIGFDSASVEIIKIMKKSANPEQYLKKANSMLKAANAAGIFTKINFLVHPGDTVSTLKESKNWLKHNKRHISAISIYPALLFPGSELEQNFEYYHNKFGTELISDSILSKWDVFDVNPSFELSMNQAQAYSLEISQIINNRKNYAYAKSFGYHGARVCAKDILFALPMRKDNPLAPYCDN